MDRKDDPISIVTELARRVQTQARAPDHLAYFAKDSPGVRLWALMVIYGAKVAVYVGAAAALYLLRHAL
jgi:hypothetical protein